MVKESYQIILDMSQTQLTKMHYTAPPLYEPIRYI